MKNLLFASSFILLSALLSTVAAQTPTPTPQGETPLRITTNLVQLDVVVTDKEGNQVKDLRPEDFEVAEDGKKQPITNFSYVTLASTGSTQPGNTTATANADKGAVAGVPPARLRPEQVRHTIALLVDDLGVSFESMALVRKALRKFVDEQMQPGDLVAILRTSGGMSALQQFTTDKRLLYSAIDNLHWLPRGRGDLSAFDGVNPTSQATDLVTREAMIDFAEFRGEMLATGTLNALNFLLRGMQDMPGRKAVVLLSENFQVLNLQGRSERMVEAMRQLADQSNRSSIVVYTLDTSGLQTLNAGANEGLATARPIPEFNPRSSSGQPLGTGTGPRLPGGDSRMAGEAELRSLDNLANARRAEYFESQGVLKYLADLTGGVAIRNTNDLSGGLQRTLEDQNGYYLIGYRPEDVAIDPKTGLRSAHKITVKIKRSGLRARARGNYYGLTDEARSSIARRTRDEQLMAALNSPFAGDVHIRLTPLVGYDQTGAFVRTMVYVDARDLQFKEESGEHKASLDIVAVTLDSSGRMLDQVSRTETVSVKGAAYERVLQNGLSYVLNVPVKQPGAYQVRVAVRDTSSEHTGSANQVADVPDLARGRLALSGIALTGLSAAAAKADSAPEEPDTQAGPAVRRLRHGMVLDYGYVIFNAQLDKATNKPQLTTQVRLFHDGKVIFTGRVSPYDLGSQTDLKRLVAGGRLQVGMDMVPGDYVLQVIVTDLLVKEKDKEKRRMATQWIDFEVVK